MNLDTLGLIERVKNSIQIGESYFREFKSALEGRPDNKKPRQAKKICEDIAEGLVAFANADGGELLVGVEDDGTVTGVLHGEEDLRAMLRANISHVFPEQILPMQYATSINIDGKIVLFFSVLKGSEEVYQLPDGRCVRRKDKNTVPEIVSQIHFDRQETKSREFDRLFVDGATVADLDGSTLQLLADKYLRGLSIEKYLQQIGLAEYSPAGLRLKMAAVLLFAKDIQKWHPRSQVRIIRIEGTELKPGGEYNAISDENVSGNVFDLLISSWEKLRPFLAYKTEFGIDAKFEQKYLYPEDACREALVNAIAHRDYSVHNGIDVFIFSNRLEIRNPGALLSSLTTESLERLNGAHESRNALIAKVLRENEFMRELGEGIRRIFSLMEKDELTKPELVSDKTSFKVVLSNKTVYSARQEAWLDLFSKFGLSANQKKIVVLGIDDKIISKNDITKALNTTDRDIYDKAVTPLRKQDILIQTRSEEQASAAANRERVKKDKIGKFKVNPNPKSRNENSQKNPHKVVLNASRPSGFASSRNDSEHKNELTGIVVMTNGAEFGFIKLDGASVTKDVYFNKTSIKNGVPLSSLKAGQRVQVELKFDAQGEPESNSSGNLRAKTVRVQG